MQIATGSFTINKNTMQLSRDFSFLFYYQKEILYTLMFFFHWLFDFVLQQDGEKKHSDNKILLHHTTYYSMMMTVAYVLVSNALYMPINYWFFPVTWVCHTITDYITSRWNAKTYDRLGVSKRWINQIGFDQWIHHAQLFLTI